MLIFFLLFSFLIIFPDFVHELAFELISVNQLWKLSLMSFPPRFINIKSQKLLSLTVFELFNGLFSKVTDMINQAVGSWVNVLKNTLKDFIFPLENFRKWLVSDLWANIMNHRAVTLSLCTDERIRVVTVPVDAYVKSELRFLAFGFRIDHERTKLMDHRGLLLKRIQQERVRLIVLLWLTYIWLQDWFHNLDLRFVDNFYRILFFLFYCQRLI